MNTIQCFACKNDTMEEISPHTYKCQTCGYGEIIFDNEDDAVHDRIDEGEVYQY